MAPASRGVSWQEWLRSWDEQQEEFNPDRERRFEVMLDILEATQPAQFRALDLGSGPGSLSLRILRRFPRARVVAVDFDPVVLRLGREALRAYGDRLTWVDARIGSEDWASGLPAGRFDAAVSTTALHWLDAPTLASTYRELGRRLRRGAVLVNGDYLPWPASEHSLARLADRVRTLRYGTDRMKWKSWTRWWKEVVRLPQLRSEVAARKLRFPHAHHPHHRSVSVDRHARSLRRAGFRDIGVVWQVYENRVLFARR